jgi:hypothetical protein
MFTVVFVEWMSAEFSWVGYSVWLLVQSGEWWVAAPPESLDLLVIVYGG